MGSYTSFGKLKKVIVGNENYFNKRLCDFSFKYFYKDNLNQNIYDQSEFIIDYEKCLLRNEQLDNLAKILKNENIEVFRPEKLEKIIDFKTPEYKSEISPASNVRDISFIYGNKIIEIA